jgi:hypothetical protein
MDSTENIVPLLLYPTVAMETSLYVKPLLSNCCIFDYFPVVVQQQVYTTQYQAPETITKAYFINPFHQ